MNRKQIRQAAVECDELIQQMASGSRDGTQLWTLASRTLARAATLLHGLAAAPATVTVAAELEPVPEPTSRLEFEVTGGDLTALRARAVETLDAFAGGRTYRFDVNAYPHTATFDGQITSWRADITAIFDPLEPTP
ncbi:hypothetical protein [Pseudonocardia zijingensis]|uniref:Uncharacterized protein n=1 Tax=Pseudonocardia zijingensis TaxID=153376 RepID=A0ABP3YNW4_9PSEU